MSKSKQPILAFRVDMINSDVLKQLKELERENYITMINIGTYEEFNHDKVYVVYQDGEQYGSCGVKGVYKKEGVAKALVTTESKELAIIEHQGSWCDLKENEKEKLINEQRKRFEIKEFTEKCKLR